MEIADVTLAERGQIVIPKEARDALGLKPGARLQLRVEGGRLLIEKRVQLDLTRWVGKGVDDGLTTHEALVELRGRPVPWPDAGKKTAKPAQTAKTAASRRGTASKTTAKSPRA